jgi:hypothetical protein
MQKGGDQKASEGVINIFAVALKVGVDFLFRKMQGFGPTYVSAL